MQGLWQSKISGYNSKDTYRKKNSRKHLIKDKIKSVLYKDNCSSVKNEADDFILEYSIIKEPYKVFYLKIKRTPNAKIKEICKYKYKIYDLYTKKEIPFQEYKESIILEEIDERDIPEFLRFNKNINNIVLKKTKITKYIRGISDKRYLYGKPLNPKWDKVYGFWSTKMKKFARVNANRKDRRYSKDYSKHVIHDDTYILKTHSTSKSIKYEIW